jgi:hypothetical protein
VTPSPVDASVLRQYLLGRLPELERERFEESYFEDDETFAALLAAEEQLTSDYLSDRLNEADRERFEHEFLTTAGGREHVRFARAMARLSSAELESKSHPAVATPTASGRWWQLAAAAVVLGSLLPGVWLFVENRRVQAELARSEASREDVRRLEQSARQQAASEAAKAQQLEAKLAARPATVISVSLLPVLREAGAHPTVVIREGVAAVVLQIGLQRIPDPNALRLTITRSPGTIVTRIDYLQPRLFTDEGVLPVTVPAALLSAGAYEATLEHLPPRGAPERLHTYEFRVQAQ